MKTQKRREERRGEERREEERRGEKRRGDEIEGRGEERRGGERRREEKRREEERRGEDEGVDKVGEQRKQKENEGYLGLDGGGRTHYGRIVKNVEERKEKKCMGAPWHVPLSVACTAWLKCRINKFLENMNLC